jgi:hypothetical protein
MHQLPGVKMSRRGSSQVPAAVDMSDRARRFALAVAGAGTANGPDCRQNSNADSQLKQ